MAATYCRRAMYRSPCICGDNWYMYDTRGAAGDMVALVSWMWPFCGAWIATGVRATGCGAAARGALAANNARQTVRVDGIDAMVASPSGHYIARTPAEYAAMSIAVRENMIAAQQVSSSFMTTWYEIT